MRSGTVEYYAAVEDLPEVTSALVVHLEDPTGETAGELLLFVATPDDVEVDDDLRATIARRVRERVSPRHVPDAVVRVPDVPRTLSGKKLEVPVKRLLLGDALDDVAATGALANPQSLDPFVAYAAARGA